MEEQKVSFDTAILAKNKNFDLIVSEAFQKENKTPVFTDWDNIESHDDFLFPDNFNGQDGWLISRPTQSLLQKWLRKVHNIRVYAEQKVAGDFGFKIYVRNTDKTTQVGKPWNRLSYFTLHFDTYEDALEAGLQKGLKLI